MGWISPVSTAIQEETLDLLLLHFLHYRVKLRAIQSMHN
jgi:hypothetical protein